MKRSAAARRGSWSAGAGLGVARADGHGGRAAAARRDAGTLRDSLSAALDQSLATWTASFARTQEALAANREDRWVAAAESLATAVRGLEARHESIERQTAAIAGVVEATRDVAALERSLDANLATLTSTGRFEETLTTLAAAVQLLAARAADQNRDMHAIRRPGKAA